MHPAVLTGTTPIHASPTVVVVDDEESIRTLLARVLEQMGCVVHEAADADEALKVMKSAPPHMALVDIRMPGHDGVWLIERMATLYPATAIVIATGVRDLDPHLTLRPGVSGYVVKPFVVEDVRKAVKHALTSIGVVPPPQSRLLPFIGRA